MCSLYGSVCSRTFTGTLKCNPRNLRRLNVYHLYYYMLVQLSSTFSVCALPYFCFFYLLQISRKAVTCMYAYRELGDIWFIQIPLHMISHPNLDTFFQELLELMFWKRQRLTPFFTKYCSLHV